MKISRIVYPLDYSDSFWTSNFGFLKNFIMQSLGHPITRVELTESMLIQAIHNAISQYYKYKEGITDLYLERLELDDQNEVTLPSTISADLIRDVFFTENSNAFGFTTPIDEGIVATLPLSSFLNTSGGIFDLGQYFMARQNLEDANRITGREKHWIYMNGKIKVFPTKLAADSKTIGVLYGKLLTPEDLENDDWIRDFSVASAKTILGTIRRKFSGFSAAGGAATSDGSDLVAEGKQDMADLIQTAKEARSGLGMFQI